MTTPGSLATACPLRSLLEVHLGQPVMQVRARPLRLGGEAEGFLVAYSADFDVDPYGIPGQDGRVITRWGHELGCVSGTVALGGKLLAGPGEQLLVYRPDGRLQVWGMATP